MVDLKTILQQSIRRARTTVARRKPLQRQIGKFINIPGLPRRRPVQGSVWAVTMVRDEEDVIGHSVLHLVNQGLDGVIVADNLSTDRTSEVLQEVARGNPNVYVGTDSMPEYFQARKMSHLAHLAHRAGAEWVILFDADEFWFAQNTSVADFLRGVSGHSVVNCYMYDGRPTTSQGIGLSDDNGLMRLDSQSSMKKVAIRPDGWVWVNGGNHEAADLPGGRTDGLLGVHLPRRTFEQFNRKVTQGSKNIPTHDSVPENFGNHWKASASLNSSQRIDQWTSWVAEGDGVIKPLPTKWSTWHD